MLIQNLSLGLILIHLFCALWIICIASAHHRPDTNPVVDYNPSSHPRRQPRFRKDPYHPTYLKTSHPHHNPHHRPHHYPRHLPHRPYPKPNPPRLRHECERKCRRGDTRTCTYQWNIHLARVMGTECGQCPDKIDDCLKNGCITAGGDRRALYIVNFSFPGPTISVCKHDKVVVFVRNRLDQSESVTIHWHGIHQRGTQWMDGVPMVTQCGIPGSTTFRYEFDAFPQGTHFWHAHSGFLSSDGVAGPLIVREVEDPHHMRGHFDFDKCNEHVMFLQEWMPIMTKSKFTETNAMHTDSRGAQHISRKRLKRRQLKASKLQYFLDNIIAKSESIKAMDKVMRPIETILINGRSSGQGNDLPLTVFKVHKGKRYRFRVIFSGITSCPLTFAIDRHNVDMIALDGQPIKRIRGVGKIKFQAGERADFVLTANQEVGNYWIHAKAAIDCEGLFGLGVLHYYGAALVPFHGVPEPLVQTSNKTFNVFSGKADENNIYVSDASALFKQKRTSHAVRLFIRSDLAQLPKDRTKGIVDDPHWWPLHARLINGHRYLPQLDRRSFTVPSSPFLSQQPEIKYSEFCGHKNFRKCPPKFCKCVNVKDVPYKRMVDIILYDGYSFFPVSHPIHLHGYFFQVLQSGILGRNNTQARVEAQLNEERLNARSEVAPFKDTVVIPAGGYVVLRFYADNPGPWLLHCHVAFHFENGMGLVIRVGKFSQWPRVPRNFPRCGNFIPK